MGISINGKEVEQLPGRSNGEDLSGFHHVFLIGSKGIPAAYGGFEKFADKLTEYRSDSRIHYHVARMAHDTIRYRYHEAECFDVPVPEIGPARAVLYDLAAIRRSLCYIRNHPEIKSPVIYVLACRIGPFIRIIKKKIEKLGGYLFVNPDGHEWMRSKWSLPVRRYWKWSEKGMIRQADLVVCDSRQMEIYICKTYHEMHPKTCFIAYGAEFSGRQADKATVLSYRITREEELFCRDNWYREYGLHEKGYYLIVGRFVPENNYETMIREFMHSSTKRKLVIVTTENRRFEKKLEKRLHFHADGRIVFTGPVYDEDLLAAVRAGAYAYLHGHEAGGTNPSLLESQAASELNLILDNEFNRETAEDTALYWTKEVNSLADLIEDAERMSPEEIRQFGERAKEHIRKEYTWKKIAAEYEKLFSETAAGREQDRQAPESQQENQEIAI